MGQYMYHELKAQHKCTICCTPLPEGETRVQCDRCRKRQAERNRKYNEKYKQRYHARLQAGLCVMCGGEKESQDFVMCDYCRVKHNLLCRAAAKKRKARAMAQGLDKSE